MPFGKTSLDHTLEDFLGKEQEKKPSYINAATISGAFIVLTTFSFILFRMGLDFGPGSIDALPFLGGIFLLLAAVSSRFVGEKKPKKEKRKKLKRMCLGGNIILMNHSGMRVSVLIQNRLLSILNITRELINR
jgi:small neutral amino acid transporter SnatA (MarC family)